MGGNSLGSPIFTEVPSAPGRVGRPWRPRWLRRPRFQAPSWMSSPPFHLLLLALTVLSTLAVGVQIAADYASHRPAFSLDFSPNLFQSLWHHPAELSSGVPFSFTLLGILLAHELGHFLTCRYYGLRASYPYFLPAPTLIGTLGAFIRIRSPILTRSMLFDVAVAGPIAGFVLAVPAVSVAVLHSRAGPVIAVPDTITLGHPLALVLLARLLRPGIAPAQLALTPVGCAAWVGLFATALNLLPMSQLDGGHILYATFGRKHRLFSRGFWLALLPLGYFWPGWFVWAGMVGLIGLSHPPVLFPFDNIGRSRQVLAVVAAAIFVLCFVPSPFSVH